MIDGLGVSTPMNRHVLSHGSDWAASIDQLQALCPNLQRVGLVTCWFGDDLRVGNCTISPRVEAANRRFDGVVWGVAGLARSQARVVSQVAGSPADGGTPSDTSVVRAIKDLAVARPGGDALSVRDDGHPRRERSAQSLDRNAGQPAYPWRGRITCHPAPGVVGSPDGSPAAASQVTAFFGAAQPGHFSVQGEKVVYSGPAEWSFRRLTLHYAALAKAAGGVDAFADRLGDGCAHACQVGVGGLSRRGAAREPAAAVRAILGPGTKITYAADWTDMARTSRSPASCAFRSTRSGPRPPSTRWRSTRGGRWRTGATGRCTQTRPARVPPGILPISWPTPRAVRAMTGITPTMRAGRHRTGYQSRTARWGSPSYTGPRIWWAGGRTRMSSGSAMRSCPRRLPGSRRRSRSG